MRIVSSSASSGVACAVWPSCAEFRATVAVAATLGACLAQTQPQPCAALPVVCLHLPPLPPAASLPLQAPCLPRPMHPASPPPPPPPPPHTHTPPPPRPARLPQELERAHKGASAHLPAVHVGPLVDQQRQVAVGLHPLQVAAGAAAGGRGSGQERGGGRREAGACQLGRRMASPCRPGRRQSPAAGALLRPPSSTTACTTPCGTM